MGILRQGVALARRLLVSGADTSSCPVSADQILFRVAHTMMNLDSAMKDPAAAWTRYGADSDGDYGYQHLVAALRRLTARQLMTAVSVIDKYPHDPRVAGTVGRAAIDISNGSSPHLLGNIAALYECLDIEALRDDYWYYPLEVIRGVKGSVDSMQPSARKRVESIAMFTLACAVSIGSARSCVTCDPDGAMVIKDGQIREFVSSQNLTTAKITRFMDDHSHVRGELHVSMIEGYFCSKTPAVLRSGYL